jgi:Pyridoxamine 5'-phosphate oxidase
LNELLTQSVRSPVIPGEVLAVFNNFFTAELTTLGKNGSPVTWPVLPVYWPERLQFFIFSPAGLSQKIVNIRRDPRVSMLFSEPVGSDLERPATVLVQGLAESPDRLSTPLGGLEPDLLAVVQAQTRKLMRRQPAMKLFMLNPLSRFVMDWYFMRLMITVNPYKILWWAAGDFSQTPQVVEVEHVV